MWRAHLHKMPIITITIITKRKWESVLTSAQSIKIHDSNDKSYELLIDKAAIVPLSKVTCFSSSSVQTQITVNLLCLFNLFERVYCRNESQRQISIKIVKAAVVMKKDCIFAFVSKNTDFRSKIEFVISVSPAIMSSSKWHRFGSVRLRLVRIDTSTN